MVCERGIFRSGHCGTCKTALPHPSMPVDVESAANFTVLIRDASLTVLVDFWAPWCGPCQMVTPEVAKLAALAADELLIVKVNTEAQPGIGASMGIRSIPTFAVFATGREVERTSGAMSAAQLHAFAVRAASQSKAQL